MLSRRSAAALAMLAAFGDTALTERALADTAPGQPVLGAKALSATAVARLPAADQAAPGAPAVAKPAEPSKPAPKPALKTAVTPEGKNQVVAILGLPVVGQGGQQVGRLINVLVDGTGEPQAAVLDIGGFMGVGSRTIAVHWTTLHFVPWDEKNPITLDLSLDQIKAVPEYKGLENKPAPVVVAAPAKAAQAH